MNNCVIITNTKHRLSKVLHTTGLKVINYESGSLVEIPPSTKVVLDFTLLESSEKESLIQHINCPMLSDLTANWGDYLCEKYPHLKGAFACAISSAKQTYELYLTDETLMKHIDNLFDKIEIKSLRVKQAGHTFSYPRTLSMIINEAYLSLEDKLASSDDMDIAMKFGVNYPKGPFEWVKENGATAFVMILDELYHISKSERYKVSPLLRKQMLIESI